MNKVKDSKGVRRWPKIKEFSLIDKDLRIIKPITRSKSDQLRYLEELEETEFEKLFKREC